MNYPLYHNLHADGCRFRVWAPEKRTVSVEVLGRQWAMAKEDEGYFFADVPGVKAGDRYRYVLEQGSYPDPASAWQPHGVYGPSAVVDHESFAWTDSDWKGVRMEDMIIYELHVGTFTEEGSFDGVISRLDELVSLGVNVIELMPVGAFSGRRNWGYDGAFLYAVQHGYGGPDGLKRLVDACHRRGIAVVLDVVYNHIGGEGNCLAAYGPYFSDKYKTPWGTALNFDGPWSDGVRAFIVNNAVGWAEHYHIDGLRLDAIHEIFDRNARTIWDELYAAFRQWEQRSGRRCWLMAESDSNDPAVLRPTSAGGLGFDAQWMDDFHHSLYVLIHPDGWKHYQDFGGVVRLAKAIVEGFVHSGEYVRFRHRRHGASSAGISGEHFIVFNQNHDLPGNRPGGERLSVLVGPAALKLAAAVVLLSPYVPMLFMGEEYGEDAPFHFFSDYRDPATTSGLIEGRKKQFADFQFEGTVRDPQDAAVFLESRLQWEKRYSGRYAILLRWHSELIRLRRSHPLLRDLSKDRLRADVVGRWGLIVYRYSYDLLQHLVCVYNFSQDQPLETEIVYASGEWRLLLASHATLPAAVSGRVTIPAPGVAVYELNLSPGSPGPGGG